MPFGSQFAVFTQFVKKEYHALLFWAGHADFDSILLAEKHICKFLNIFRSDAVYHLFVVSHQAYTGNELFIHDG